MTERLGPAAKVLATAVARRYYLAGESKVEIAAALGISRFKVARLLDTAHELGIVRIEIASDDVVDLELSDRLREALQLSHAAVVLGHGADPAGREDLGRTAAELLCEIVTDQDVLGLPWARSVAAMIRAIETFPPIPVVQLSGSLVIPGEATSPVDVVGRIAGIAGGEAHLFYSPLVLDDAASAAVMRRQPSVADAMRAADRVTIAVVGVGVWQPGQSTVHDTLSPADQQAVAAAGVVGEVMGIYLGADGPDVATPLTDRTVTLTAQQLRGIPEVIAVVRGADKAPAVRAALAGGLVKSLVVDTELANTLLD